MTETASNNSFAPANMNIRRTDPDLATSPCASKPPRVGRMREHNRLGSLHACVPKSRVGADRWISVPVDPRANRTPAEHVCCLVEFADFGRPATGCLWMREGSARRNGESRARNGEGTMAMDTFTLIASQYALEEDALED